MCVWLLRNEAQKCRLQHQAHRHDYLVFSSSISSCRGMWSRRRRNESRPAHATQPRHFCRVEDTTVTGRETRPDGRRTTDVGVCRNAASVEAAVGRTMGQCSRCRHSPCTTATPLYSWCDAALWLLGVRRSGLQHVYINTLSFLHKGASVSSETALSQIKFTVSSVCAKVQGKR